MTPRFRARHLTLLFPEVLEVVLKLAPEEDSQPKGDQYDGHSQEDHDR